MRNGTLRDDAWTRGVEWQLAGCDVSCFYFQEPQAFVLAHEATQAKARQSTAPMPGPISCLHRHRVGSRSCCDRPLVSSNRLTPHISCCWLVADVFGCCWNRLISAFGAEARPRFGSDANCSWMAAHVSLYASYIDHHTLSVHSSRGIGLLGQAHICRIAGIQRQLLATAVRNSHPRNLRSMTSRVPARRRRDDSTLD